jgi:hypothetical protein
LKQAVSSSEQQTSSMESRITLGLNSGATAVQFQALRGTPSRQTHARKGSVSAVALRKRVHCAMARET